MKIASESGDITCHQLEEIYRGIKSNQYGYEDFQNYLDSILETTINFAIERLGASAVVTPEQGGQFWNCAVLSNRTIKNSRRRIARAAESNKAGRTKIRIFPAYPLTNAQQFNLLGMDASRPASFDSTSMSSWQQEDRAHLMPTPGMKMFDFKTRFNGMDWDSMEDEFAKLLTGISRADETEVVQGLAVFGGIHGENLLDDVYHWGYSMDSRGRRTRVGRSLSGIRIGEDWPDHSDNSLGAVAELTS